MGSPSRSIAFPSDSRWMVVPSRSTVKAAPQFGVVTFTRVESTTTTSPDSSCKPEVSVKTAVYVFVNENPPPSTTTTVPPEAGPASTTCFPIGKEKVSLKQNCNARLCKGRLNTVYEEGVSTSPSGLVHFSGGVICLQRRLRSVAFKVIVTLAAVRVAPQLGVVQLTEVTEVGTFPVVRSSFPPTGSRKMQSYPVSVNSLKP
mmetsp:Transcript_55562/g.111423  ORF Transcript_55562/g.111423 Transcript_55562/m.111423 type:complete len:202 (+) Transcript_55562:414-1019(+)